MIYVPVAIALLIAGAVLFAFAVTQTPLLALLVGMAAGHLFALGVIILLTNVFTS